MEKGDCVVSGGRKQHGSTKPVKIRDWKQSAKYFYGFCASLKSSLYELRLQDKPCCCNRASEESRLQWQKGDLWLLGECSVETKTKNLLSGLRNRSNFPLLKHRAVPHPSLWATLAAATEEGRLAKLEMFVVVVCLPFWTCLNHTKPCWIFRSFPIETRWAQRSEFAHCRGFVLHLASFAGRPGAVWGREIWTVSPGRSVGWELGNNWAAGILCSEGNPLSDHTTPERKRIVCPSPTGLQEPLTIRKFCRTALPGPRCSLFYTNWPLICTSRSSKHRHKQWTENYNGSYRETA